MQQEIEVKILEIPVEETVKKLESLGAVKVFDGPIESVLFDYADSWLWKKKRACRLRKMGDKVQFVLKENKSYEDVKHNVEYEVEVSDFDTMKEVILRMGLAQKYASKKHRVSYQLEDAHYEFDTIDGIPTYLELEVHIHADLEKYLGLLGYTMKDTVDFGERRVREHYHQVPSRRGRRR